MAVPEKHQYLLSIQYLGFRYSGWQRQPGQKTVEGMLIKTLRFVLPGRKVKLIGAGRTDAMVSTNDFGVQFLLQGPALESNGNFLSGMNQNLPPDIRLISVNQVSPAFNAIRDCKLKRYRYYFSHGEKPHPFCAPFLGYFPGNLDLHSMEAGAACFQGTHNFKAFIVRPSANTRTTRTVVSCKLQQNTDLIASFFPSATYFMEVEGSGFGRNQVRMMMAGLLALGRGRIGVEDLEASLDDGRSLGITEIVPASGLHLEKTDFGDTSI